MFPSLGDTTARSVWSHVAFHVPVSRRYDSQVSVESCSFPCSRLSEILQPGQCGVAPNSKPSVYDILPSASAITGYAVDLRKLSANSLAQFLVGAQRMPNSL